MNYEVKTSDDGLLTTSELAARPNFTLGLAIVSPSTRTVVGPGGCADVEPRVMQVLVTLADSAGQVVTRDHLFHRCWGGVYVGDDSLNRAIAAVRRVASEIAGGSFTIETIPRTGYRLIGDIALPERAAGDRPTVARRVPRRTVIFGAIAAAGAGGLGLWSIRRSQEDRRFKELMDRGLEALRYGDPFSKSVEYYQRAATMRPDDAKAQGLFAYSQAMEAEWGDPRGAGVALQRADRAARTALALNPNDPNARLALVVLQRSMLDLATTEDRLRGILASAPNNVGAMVNLWGLLQSAGRSRDAFALIERANALEPLAARTHYPRAQLLWILGRYAEADRVIDRAMQYWPKHRFVRFARFTIFAFTGRPRAALAMLDEVMTRHFTPTGVSVWRASLVALDQRTPASIAAARRANLEAARSNPALTNQTVLALSGLGEVDAAFEVANGYLLFRRPVALPSDGGTKSPQVKSTAWRFSPWLFTPPVAALRADPRFKTLCDGIGLTEYWAKRGIKPDYQLGNT